MQNREEKKAERLRKKAEKDAKMAALKAEWPNISVDYAPELWKQIYREKHAENFRKSVDLLMKRENIENELEAENALMNILLKVTFIETNLTKNGAQSAEELYENLDLARSDEQPIPFSSADDVASFCDSMSPVFQKNVAVNKYRNTGVQSRKFVQMVKERLELGDVIDSNTFDEILRDFQDTMKVVQELDNFARQEAQLDFSSLHHLACCVPEFRFDKKERRLHLKARNSDEAERLPLYLPIFTDTINSSHFFKCDQSRAHSLFIKQYKFSFPERSEALVCCEEGFKTEVTCFRGHLSNRNVELNYSFVLMDTRVCPNQIYNQFEGLAVYPYPFSLHNSFVAKGVAQCFEKRGKLTGSFTFDEAIEQLEFWNKYAANRVYGTIKKNQDEEMRNDSASKQK